MVFPKLIYSLIALIDLQETYINKTFVSQTYPLQKRWIGSKMIFLIVSCLVATSLAMPADPPPSEVLNASEIQYKGIQDVIQDAATNLAENAAGISNQVQDQIASLPQQISQNVLAPIQGIVKPVENQDSYQISFVIPKPSLPSWLPSLPSSFQWPNNWSFSNFLRPANGRVIPGLRSGYYGVEENGENLNQEKIDESAGHEKQPEILVIAYAVPNPFFSNPLYPAPPLPYVPQYPQPAFNPYHI